jgi:hypothetical protein
MANACVHTYRLTYEVAHYLGFSNEKILTVNVTTRQCTYLAGFCQSPNSKICFRLGKYVFMFHNTWGRI